VKLKVPQALLFDVTTCAWNIYFEATPTYQQITNTDAGSDATFFGSISDIFEV
jgi:hypothetical protein